MSSTSVWPKGRLIYDDATEDYRLSLSRELNRSRFARLGRKMGTCPESEPTSIVVNSGSSGTTVSASYKTKCSLGVLEESFMWVVVDGKAKLESYDPKSPLLLSD